MKKSLLANLLPFLLLLAPLLLAYQPIFTETFIFNDDSLMWEMEGGCQSHPQFNFFLVIGRVFFPLLACPLWSFVQTASDLSIGRFINVLMLSVSALLFYKWLIKNSVNTFHAFFLTVAIFVLPTFQAQVILVNSFPHTVGLLISSLAGLAAYRRSTFLAIALLFISMAIYTPLSTFYVAMIAVPWLFSLSWREFEWQRALYLFGVYFVAAFSYLVFARFAFKFLPLWLGEPVEIFHRVIVTAHLASKAAVFLKGGIVALNLWNVPPTTQFAWLTGITLLVGGAAVAAIGCFRERISLNQGALRALGILFLFSLAMAPNLAAESNIISYRMLSTISVLTVVVLYAAMKKISQTFLDRFSHFALSSVLLVFALWGVREAHLNLRDFYVLPAKAEWNYLKQVFQEKDLSEVRRVHLVRPPLGNFLSASHPWPIADDEFGLLSTGINGPFTGLIRAALIESGLKKEDLKRIKITSSENPEPADVVLNTTPLFDEFYSKFKARKYP